MTLSFHKQAECKLSLKLGQDPAHGSVVKADELQNPRSSKRETEAMEGQESVMNTSWEGRVSTWDGP